MHKSILALLIALQLPFAAFAQTSAPAAHPAAKPQVIIVVDLAQVFNNYNVAVAMKLKFQGAVEDANSTYQSMGKGLSDINNQFNDIQAKLNDPASTAAQREQYKKDLDTLRAQYQTQINNLTAYKQAKERDLSSDNQTITSSLIGNIISAVQSVAKKHNATFVFNSNGINSVLFADPTYDATKEVIGVLNAAAAPAAAKPAASTP